MKTNKLTNKELYNTVFNISQLNADKIDCLLEIIENVVSHATITHDVRLGFIIQDGLKKYDTIAEEGREVVAKYQQILEDL